MYRFYKGHMEDGELDEEDLTEVNEVRKVVLSEHIVEAIYTTTESPTEYSITDHRQAIMDRFKDAIYFRDELYLAYLGLSSKDVANIVVPFLQEYPDISELDITSNEIGDEGIKALISIDTLKCLKASSCEITDVGVKLLANTQLKELDISDNFSVGNEGIEALAKNNSIEFLNISFIKNFSKEALGLFILNTTLTYLDARYTGKMCHNEVTDIIQKTLEHRKQTCYNQKIAFLMGTHPKLEEKSLLFTAFAGNKPLVKELLSYVKPTPLEFKESMDYLALKKNRALKNKL